MRFLTLLRPLYMMWGHKRHIHLGRLLSYRNSYNCFLFRLLISFDLIWRLLERLLGTWANKRVRTVAWFVWHRSSYWILLHVNDYILSLQWYSPQSFGFSLVAAVEFDNIRNKSPRLSLIFNLFFFILNTRVHKNSIFEI